MLRLIPILLVLASWGLVSAQSPPDLRLPHVRGDGSDQKQQAAPITDPIASYQNRREAALAAFQAGYKAATVEHKRPRAIRLILIALRRDPKLAPALFDMAVLCSEEDRWQDAISFLRETQNQAATDARISPLVSAELERIETIARLESTPEGKKRRRFDLELWPALRKDKDPFAALAIVRQLPKIDSTRWEGPALAAILHANIGEFPESATELEAAARLADRARATQLRSAAEVARKESIYLDEVRNADSLWEKRQFDQAAPLYAKAWEQSAGHWNAALDAVTGYLLADQAGPAVDLLSQMKDSAPPALRAKAMAMLKELGAISEVARNAAGQPALSAPSPPADPAARIRALVGPITTAQMELTVRPGPDLLDDKTIITPVPDDEISSGSSDLMLMSSDSIFALYQRNLAAAPGSPGPAPAQAPPEVPPAPAAETPAAPPAPVPNLPSSQPRYSPPPAASASASPPVALSRGAGQPVTIRSDPPGATVVGDDGLNCVAPCQPLMSPGRHTLLATKAGYRDARKIFTVEKSSVTPVEVVLEAKRGWLNVESEIPGAPVFLDGHKTDKLTPARFILAEGSYEVGVEIDSRRSVKKVQITDESLVGVKF